jgi:peroxiredoxin Q/BCP
VVVGPDDAEAFRAYWRDNDLPFVGLPDPDKEVLDLWGQQFKLLRLGRMPVQAVVDREGVIRFLHHGSSMKDIPANETMLELMDDLTPTSRSAEEPAR